MKRTDPAKRRLCSFAALAVAASLVFAVGCEVRPESAETTGTAQTAAPTEAPLTTYQTETAAVTEETTADPAEAAGIRPAQAADGDRWDNAVDGMVLETVTGKTFKGYVLLIRDPSRVSVAIKDTSFTSADRIYEIVDRCNAVAAINGGEFPDTGTTTEPNPMGLTYSQGECVWNDGSSKTFMGFTEDNTLIVEEGTSKDRADSLGIRDAVAFQNYNTLISNDGANVTFHYADSTTDVSQRTAIGQLADGTVIFLVTDGRTAASLGATRNDIIDILASYGTVTAGMLDGGASSLLWCRDWYTKFGGDTSVLDEWQLGGLVNNYKAFTTPRLMPTYFIVSAGSGEGEVKAPQTTEIVAPSGWTVTVDGAALGDKFITDSAVHSREDEYLPNGVAPVAYVKYAIDGSPEGRDIAVTDESGAAAELIYDGRDRVYRAYLPSDASLEAEFADYAVNIMSGFALAMSADNAWGNVSQYFDPSSEILNEASLAAQFTWTVLTHDSANVHDAAASRFVRYSDDVFSCRVTLTNTLTQGASVWNDRLDWTVIFKNVGGSWLIWNLVYNG